MEKYNIGVMQGRLLPKYKGRYQAHPVGYWKDEFIIAKTLNLDCIEFIFDLNDYAINPLLGEQGLNEIKEISKKTGVAVKTICADYFMEAPLHSPDQDIAYKSEKVMIQLLNNASILGVTDVVIPCVDQSSLNSKEAKGRFIERMVSIVKIAEKVEVNLSLETDLPPKPFVKLLEKFQSNRVTVNYDLGNSAALGYDPVQELSAYGSLITDIHIKDRRLGGGPVVLGEGAVNFEIFFKKLKDINFQGPFIMQAYRDEEGLNVFKKQLDWIKIYLDQVKY